MFRVVIPARFGSSRLPGKPLMNIGAKPMLQWVHEVGLASGAAEVIIATDDDRILAAAGEFGAQARMTSLTHPSGTDRIAEVALEAGWGEDDIVVNLQGDEPLMPPELVRQAAELLQRHPSAAIATLATRITSVRDLLDPGIVKVVTDSGGKALYFSRAPIPWGRDTAPAGIVSQRGFRGFASPYRAVRLSRVGTAPALVAARWPAGTDREARAAARAGEWLRDPRRRRTDLARPRGGHPG